MIFGWGKKNPETTEIVQESKEILLPDVVQVLSHLEEVRSSTLMAEARSFRSKTLQAFSQLAGIAKSLEKDEISEEDVDKRLKVAVMRGRSQVISIIKTEASRDIKDIRAVGDVTMFYDGISQSIKKIGDALGRHTRVIHIFAKKHAARLKDILSGLNSDREEFLKSKKKFEKFCDSAAEIRDILGQIQSTKDEEKVGMRKIEQLKESAKETASDISDAERSIDIATSSSEYADYVKTSGELDRTRSEYPVIRQEIEAQFTKISRPLSKYVYVSALDKSQTALLENLVADPASSIKSSSKNDIIQILMAVRKGVLAGSVSVKDQSKSISQIDQTVERLDHLISITAEYEKKCNALQATLKTFDAVRLQNDKDDLARHHKNLKECNGRMSEIEAEIADSASRRSELVSKIEIILYDVSSTRYQISQ